MRLLGRPVLVYRADITVCPGTYPAGPWPYGDVLRAAVAAPDTASLLRLRDHTPSPRSCVLIMFILIIMYDSLDGVWCSSQESLNCMNPLGDGKQTRTVVSGQSLFEVWFSRCQLPTKNRAFLGPVKLERYRYYSHNSQWDDWLKSN